MDIIDSLIAKKIVGGGGGGGSVPEYSGSYTVTPTEQTQTLATKDKKATNNITVNPIPSQYVVPTGTKQITQNGTGIDVASFAAVDVNVSGGGGGGLTSKSDTFSGTLNISEPNLSARDFYSATGYDGKEITDTQVCYAILTVGIPYVLPCLSAYGDEEFGIDASFSGQGYFVGVRLDSAGLMVSSVTYNDGSEEQDITEHFDILTIVSIS